MQPNAASHQTKAEGRSLRLLSYNIQAGIESKNYRGYLIQSWKHLLPYPHRFKNLERIAQLLRGFDVVGLQEVDAGSIRTDFINQLEFLAQSAQFPYWHNQVNRNLGHLAKISNGLLSQIQPTEIAEHKLPGFIPGRGALFVRYGKQKQSLVVLILHLALGSRARSKQLGYIREVIRQFDSVIVMGDMNCTGSRLAQSPLLKDSGLQLPHADIKTFPSWRPQHGIDHFFGHPKSPSRKALLFKQPLLRPPPHCHADPST